MRTNVRFAWLVLVLFVAGSLSAGAVRLQQAQAPPDIPGTFSVLGFDPDTNEIGAAVQSRVFSVGNGVIWGEAGVGVVATQATVNVAYGPQGLALLRQGMAPNDIIKKLLADDDVSSYRGAWPIGGRQVAVMNAKGEMAAYTGPTAPQEFGDFQGKFCTAQGNTLGRPDHVWPPADGNKPSKVPEAMCGGFEKAVDAKGVKIHLALRLVQALEAGDAAGGDHRGKQSAALLIVKKNGGPWPNNDVVLRLQVDDSPEPIKELRRVVEASPNGRRSGGKGGGL
jgi:uncharacterized Ntn-hydrolase superfamily protein